MIDPAFEANADGLRLALDALLSPGLAADIETLPDRLPEDGIGEVAALEHLAPIVLGGARRLGAAEAFAHMDPPTPWITWATTLWNASLNQNLLHPDVAPAARDLEQRVVHWLAPSFGMDGGHMTPGSTVANLTALWAARELRGIRTVVASAGAHLSVAKAAHILGLEFLCVSTDRNGAMDAAMLPADLSHTALVLTAGTTGAGAIDPLTLIGHAPWTHVDAAWAGALRLSDTHGSLLDGIESADSVAVSAHKWFFQPKESGLIFFRDTASAHDAVSFGGAYLAAPNVGVLGSHGAIAVPLLATLLAWGRTGLAERIERSMRLADTLWQRLEEHPQVALFAPQASGVILWRPRGAREPSDLLRTLPAGSTSLTHLDGKDWLRHVAANPCLDLELLWSHLKRALEQG